MHEMALCEGIRRVVDQAADRPDVTRVTRVRLEMGRFAGVEKLALAFARDVVMRGSKAEGATLDMIDLPGRALCYDCMKDVEIEDRLIEIETGILSQNDRYARANRARLAALGAYAVNLVSSPGSGKTTLLCATIRAMTGPVAVIEGDQQTSNDADRIRDTGAPACQVNTGKGCHLDGHMVGHAPDHLNPPEGATLFIENVGNLVCPAAFDLGEDAKVAILSVTEGEDKPLKYPDMFTASRLAILNKTDLAPYCDVDLDLYEANLRRVNPNID